MNESESDVDVYRNNITLEDISSNIKMIDRPSYTFVTEKYHFLFYFRSLEYANTTRIYWYEEIY